MKKEKRNIDPKYLVLNDGSVDWLPANPRTWTQLDIDRTSRSIAQDPDFLEDRPILAFAEDDMPQFMVFAGNLRTTAAKGLALKSVPVVVYYPETEEDREAVKRRAMKDNGTFGSWDYDALANEWDDLPLAEFGVPVWNAEKFSGDDIDLSAMELDTIPPKGESASGYESITFLFPVGRVEAVKNFIKDNDKATLSEKIIQICQDAVAK